MEPGAFCGEVAVINQLGLIWLEVVILVSQNNDEIKVHFQGITEFLQ